ncbi:hypothetical protein B0H67DRAFT_485510 [Lasiosphaeris hirsuta]|uniref:DUF7924 domain-containing protein n=1 Tax=Lasiosphaeris hirsuta TaxID=260670 RepID=A0AA40AP61_9PEZI|nr:hypothetical protein B0H67DRAFT_485510 [Lasiosphaeris hirsuta]
MEGTVRHTNYRNHCLAHNHIYIQHPLIPLPDTIATHVEQLARILPKVHDLTPDIVASAVWKLEELGLQCYEGEVTDLLRKYFFPEDPTTTGLKATAGIPMARHLIPRFLLAPHPVPQLRLDLLYGYPGDMFTEAQHLALGTLHEQVKFFPQACSNLLLPFLIIEFKAAAGTRGNLWAATNQCAGGSAACLQAAGQLNAVLAEVGCSGCLPNLCYSLAVDNNLAQLYVSWKDDMGSFYMQRVDSFLLLNPEHFVSFRQRVLAILEWGAGARLHDVRLALDVILGARRGAVTKTDCQVSPGSGPGPGGGGTKDPSWFDPRE